MKLTNTLFSKWLFAAAMLLFTTVQLAAQDSCTFTLQVYDRFGDGWDDSQVFIKFGNNAERGYTHDGVSINSADSVHLIQIRVRSGDSIIIRYDAQGTYQNEIKYALFNNAGDLVFGDGLTPTTGIVFRGLSKCVNCGTAINARVSAIRSTNATLTWSPTIRGNQPTYLVEWDTVGFQYGRGRNRFRTTDTFGIMTNLTEVTKYGAYIQTLCTGNDSSSIVGPLNFTTDTATNVGVIAIQNPISSCNLSVDSIKIVVKNFAGSPQQLIPFKASVNGQLLNIPFPADGLFTGVLSKDSTTTLTFKTPYDFSAPGIYNIAAWTDISADKNKKNDTFKVTIIHPRLITSLPYIQNFELSQDTWFVSDTVGNSTWEYGTPNGPAIKGAFSGTKAWTTWKDSTYRLNEFSYLMSPCFDFRSQGADPRISFRLAVNSEGTYDGLWMEQTVDDGRTWTPVGGRAFNTGVNWYNDTLTSVGRSTWSTLQDSVKPWRLVQNTLRGTAGRSSVRFRFGFKSDVSTVGDGVAIDDIMVMPVATQDLAMQTAVNVSSSICGSDVANTLTVRLSNVGTSSMQTYTVNYQVGTQPVVSENANLLIAPNQTLPYRFTAPFNTTAAGAYPVKIWVSSGSDLVRANDTVSTSVNITLERPLLVTTFPYYQNFENGSGTWSTTDSLSGTWALVTPTNPIINSAASGSKAFKVGALTTNGLYNNNEWSYVLSPCFNFSSFTTDPRISFAVNVHSQAANDGAWLEGSKDGGATWTRIGTRNTGVNWYNDSITAIRTGVWAGTANIGWRNAQNTLTGYAGQANARFRFVFRTNTSTNSVNTATPYGGFAFDNIIIGSPVTSDLANSLNAHLNTTACGSVTDTVAIQITNLGTTPQTTFVANYRIDNQTPVSETVNLTTPLAVGQSGVYRFTTLFNSTAVGTHSIRTWVRQANDTTYINDTATTTYFIPSAISNFASYNFDDGLAPQYWTAQGTVTVGRGTHGNAATNGAMYANIWSSNKTISGITHRFGAIRTNKDSVSYDYRFVNESSPYAAYGLTNRDTMYFQIATDCNEDWKTADTVTAANHVQSTNYLTKKFGLGAYIGKNVRFRWRVVSQITATIGYFIDIDNVNFLTCPESFSLKASVRNSRSGQTLGSIALTPTVGLAPFTYTWSNGRTTDSIGGLAAGAYIVTVTDARGCSQTATYNVLNTVGTNDVTGIFSRVAIMPNPTSDNAILEVEFARPIDARVQILNIMGQPLSEMYAKGVSQQQFQLDLSDKPAGVYLVRITADNRSHVARIVKQ